jgi:hypothetical protein
VDGRLPDRAPLAQARREAAAVKRTLEKAGWEGDVHPAVCFASDTFEGGCASVGPVTVLNVCEIGSWLVARPVVLGAGEVERIAQLMAMCT